MSAIHAGLDLRVSEALSMVVTRLADDFGIGVRELAEDAGVSVGTVEAALHNEEPRAALRVLAASLKLMADEVEGV
jgi:hypothetical protein